jgi:hypothetical protein
MFCELRIFRRRLLRRQRIFQQVKPRFHSQCAGGFRTETDVLAVRLNGLGRGIGLLRRDTEVKPCGCEIRGDLDGAAEASPCLAITPLTLVSHTQPIECLGVVGGETKGIGKGVLGGRPLLVSQVGLAQSAPSFEGAWLQADERPEGLRRARCITLLEKEASKVVMGQREIRVDARGLLISAGGFGELTRGMAGEAEMVPCLRIPGEEFNGFAQAANGVGGSIGFQKAFAIQQSTGSARAACRGDHGQRSTQYRGLLPWFSGSETL